MLLATLPSKTGREEMGRQVGREKRKWKESTEEKLIREETNLKPQQLCPRRNQENTVEVLGENFSRDKSIPRL